MFRKNTSFPTAHNHCKELQNWTKSFFENLLSYMELVTRHELLVLIEERGLLDDLDWDSEDHHAIANLLVGRSLKIYPNNPADQALVKFVDRMNEEYERSAYFHSIMKPPCVLFHTLPINPNHWQTSNNDGILDNANRAILSEAGSAHSNIGMNGSAISLPFPTDSSIVACRNVAERELLIDLVQQQMDGADGLSYTFIHVTVPITYNDASSLPC